MKVLAEYCDLCGRAISDLMHMGLIVNGQGIPGWREPICCKSCGDLIVTNYKEFIKLTAQGPFKVPNQLEKIACGDPAST